MSDVVFEKKNKPNKSSFLQLKHGRRKGKQTWRLSQRRVKQEPNLFSKSPRRAANGFDFKISKNAGSVSYGQVALY